MRAIVLEEPGRLVQSNMPEPGPIRQGEALVRVRRIGICGTDLHAYRGRQPFFSYPRILGHELGVEIAEVGPNPFGLTPGDRCAIEPYLACGHCVACRAGKTNCCVHLRVLGVHADGGMREWLTVPVEKLHRSGRLALEQLALVETLGIGAHAVERADLDVGEWVLVIGAGPIGLGVIQFALVAGARVVVLDLNAGRLAFCRRELGIEYTLMADEDPLGRLLELTDGALPTAVFDATGNTASMTRAFDYVAHGGRLIFVGLVSDDITFHDPSFHRRELTLLASRNATRASFLKIIELIEQGHIDTTPWISQRTPFEALIEEFPGWVQPGSRVIKAMVEL